MKMITDTFKDISKYLPAQIVPGIAGFISIPILTRLFPPEEYGNYILVRTTITVFTIIIGWLSMSIIRFFPAYERDKKLDEFYATVLKMTVISILVLSLIFSGALLVLKSRLSVRLYHLLWIGVLVFILTSCFGVLFEFLRAKRRIGWYSGFMVWKSVTAIGFGILLVIVFHFGVEGLLWGSVLSLAIAFPFFLKITMVQVSLNAKNISISLTSDIAKYGFPLVIGNLAAWILSLSDRYILEFFRGSQEVGIYSASYTISENSVMLIATLFALTSGSLVFNLWEKEGKEKSQEFVSNLTRYYLLIGVPAVIGLSVLSKPIIRIMTGQQYFEGYKIISLVTSGAFLLGLQQRFQVGFLFYKKTSFVTIAIVSSGLLNLFLNFQFVPKYGYMAAAITTLVSYAFLLCVIIILSRRLFLWQFPFKSLMNSIVASAIMGIIVYFIGSRLASSVLLNIFLGICSGALVYSIMLFLLGEFQSSEKKAMKQVLKKCLPYGLIPER